MSRDRTPGEGLTSHQLGALREACERGELRKGPNGFWGREIWSPMAINRLLRAGLLTPTSDTAIATIVAPTDLGREALRHDR